MAAEFTRTQLFGGAITAPLPNGYIDASDLRQVPDNQEVFLSPSSNASIIISLLERVSASDVSQALQVHFEDAVIGAENRRGANADVPIVASVEQILGPAGAECEGEVAEAGVLVAAMQTSPQERERQKQRAKGEDEVVFTGVIMGIVRLRRVETDLLIEFHTPHVLGQFDETVVALEDKRFGTVVAQAKAAVQQIIKSLQIVDWSLFGA